MEKEDKKVNQRNRTIVFVLVAFAFFYACTGSYSHKEALHRILMLKDEDPLRALELIDSTLAAGSLPEEDFAGYCMAGCLLRDSLGQTIYPDSLLKKAESYFKKTSQKGKEAEIRYYQGRYYADQGENEAAIKQYLEALPLADEVKKYNLGGYISSYLADLYQTELATEPARNYYVQAENYFNKAGNRRSRLITIRDQGDTYTLERNYQKAIEFYMRVDSMLDSAPDDSILKSSVANHIGIVYQEMKDFTRARNYFKKAIRYDPSNSSAYFSLAHISLEIKDRDEAKRELAVALDSLPLPEDQEILYNRIYEVEKEAGNYQSALHYLEQSRLLFDSLASNKHAHQLYEIEQKYNQEQMANANMRLSLQRNQILLFACILLFLLLLSFVFYQMEINKRKRKNLELLRISEAQGAIIREKQLINERNEIELKAKEQKITQVRRFAELIKASLFRNSVLYRKIELISNLPLQERKKQSEYKSAIEKIFGGPFLSEEDKVNLKGIADELYPSFTDKLQEAIPHLSEEEILFCCLLMFDLSISDLAIILNKTVNTIKSKRHRIMKKVGMTNQNLKIEDYLKHLTGPESPQPED